VKGRLKITVIVPLVLPIGLSERSAEKLQWFFPNFLTFTLDIPLALQQRGSEEKESTMFFQTF